MSPPPSPDRSWRNPRVLFSYVFVVALVGFLPGLGVYQYWQRAPVGGRCHDNDDCRSRQCLSGTRSVPLGDTVMQVASPVGACTTTCASDSDRAAGQACVNAETQLSMLRLSPTTGRADITLCAPRDSR